MADRIITVTNPSVVTNDTLSGYNNYSDQDGQLGAMMTPTEATNGHTVALSDGVVHEVTTRPVGTTNGEFSSVVSNPVEVDLTTGANILFEDDFAGTTINTGKWLDSGDSAGFVLTQNDSLIMTGAGSLDEATLEVSLRGQSVIDIANVKCVIFHAITTNQNGSGFFVGMTKDIDPLTNQDRFGLQRRATAGQHTQIALTAGTSYINELVSGSLFNAGNTFKMAFVTGELLFYRWDGADWLQIGSGGTFTGTGNHYPCIGGEDRSAGANTTTITNYYVLNEDISTEYPI